MTWRMRAGGGIDPPDNGSLRMASSTLPVFDALPLQRLTGGNAAMQTERLALFMTEAERLMTQIEAATDLEVRTERVRALSGLSRSVGAVRVAHEAKAVEALVDEEAPDLSALREALTATFLYLTRSTG